MTRVLHVFPDSVLEPGQAHLGSTKDIRGRTQYFADRGMIVDECAHERSAAGMRGAVSRVRPETYDLIVVEFPLSGWAIGRLRRRWPTALLLTRSENAELLHRRDWIRAMGPSVSAAKLAVRTVLNVVAEIWAAHRSDAILSISEWETRHYWPKLTTSAKTWWLPYYVPDAYLDELQSSDSMKRLDCVCLTSTKSNPLIEDSVRGFQRAVSQSPEVEEWRFLVTGEASGVATSSRIENTGLLASPGDLLRGSRAVVLLSDLGFGFKTKLLEAIVAGNRVLVTPGLFRRVPEVLHPWTVEVDLDAVHSFTEALTLAAEPAPTGDPNRALREQHHAVLDELISRHLDPEDALGRGQLL